MCVCDLDLVGFIDLSDSRQELVLLVLDDVIGAVLELVFLAD